MTRLLPLALVLAFGGPALAGDSPEAAKLAEQLKSPEVGKRVQAAGALNRLSPAVSSVIPDLVAALKDEYFDVRENAAEALRKLGAKAVPALCRALDEDDYYMQRYAARTLGRMGGEARESIPMLGRALGRTGTDARNEVARAIVAVGGDNSAIIPNLLSGLADESPETRELCAAAFATAGKGAVEPLIKLLSNKNPVLAVSAARALGEIGPPAEAAVTPLVNMMLAECQRAQDEAAKITDAYISDRSIRYAIRDSVSVAALGKIGAQSVPPLKQILEEGDPQKVRWALAAVGRTGAAAVPALIVALKDKSPDIRKQAIAALGRLGAGAASAVPALTEAAKDADQTVAQAATEALKAISAGR